MVATMARLARPALAHTQTWTIPEPLALAPDSGTETFDVQDEVDSSPTARSSVNWHDLVDRIKRNDDSGMEELYGLFARGIRFYLCRQLGAQELEDKIHDTFLIVVQAVRRGDLREPERLMGFVRTVVRRQVVRISIIWFIIGATKYIWMWACGWLTRVAIQSRRPRSVKKST